MTQPAAVTACNMDMENLITDSNRSIATYAITTLLKTGNEASVDRLMKQISSFMADITDEFKIIVVDAIRSLCLKFPAKQAVMLSFLSGVLRDEGGYEFKHAVVEAIFDMIKFIKDCREAGAIYRYSVVPCSHCSFSSPLRIHRGLRIHQTFRTDTAPAWIGGPENPQPDQIHSIHLQSGRA